MLKFMMMLLLTTGYAHVDGLNVYYETLGSGSPLVLVPGGGSTVQTSYGKVINRLARSHRVIAIEPQIEGHTADRPTPPTFERDADDVAAVLQHLHVTQADFMGFSNGGNIVLEVAIRHPQLVRRMVLASAFTRRDALPDAFWDGMHHATPQSMPPALRQAYLRAAPDPSHLPVMVQRLTQRMLAFQDIPAAQLHAIRAPALLIFGDHDVYRPEHFIQMYEQLPNAQLAVFPNSHHGQYMGEVSSPGPYPFVDAFLTMVTTFLGVH